MEAASEALGREDPSLGVHRLEGPASLLGSDGAGFVPGDQAGRDHLVVATATLPPGPVPRGGRRHPAGQEEPTPRILRDMPGNVDEWVPGREDDCPSDRVDLWQFI